MDRGKKKERKAEHDEPLLNRRYSSGDLLASSERAADRMRVPAPSFFEWTRCAGDHRRPLGASILRGRPVAACGVLRGALRVNRVCRASSASFAC